MKKFTGLFILGCVAVCTDAALESLDVSTQLTEKYGSYADKVNPVQVVGAADNYNDQINFVDPSDNNGRLTRVYIRFTTSNHRINGRNFNLPVDGAGDGYVGSEVLSLSDPSTTEELFMSGSAFQVPLDTVMWYPMLPQDESGNGTPYNDLAFALKFTDTDSSGSKTAGDVMEIVGIVYSTGTDSVYGKTADELTALLDPDDPVDPIDPIDPVEPPGPVTNFVSGVTRLRPSAYYPMDDLPGLGTVVDPTDGTYGKLQNTNALPVSVVGAKGQAWDYYGVANSICARGIPVAEIGYLPTTSGMSVSFWMKNQGSTSNIRLCGSGWGSVFEVKMNGTDRVGFIVDGQSYEFASSTGVADGQWHHLVASIDYASAADNVKLYVDGQFYRNYSQAFDESFNDVRSDHPLYIGARPSGGTSYHFNGALDDFALFSYPLSSADVALLYGYDPAEPLVMVPEVEAGETLVLTNTQTSAQLMASVTNVDLSDPGTTVTWSQVDGGAPVVFDDATSLTPTVTFAPQGQYDAYHLKLRVQTLETFDEDICTVVFHDARNPATRTFSEVPTIGTHPRILFSPADLSEFRSRYSSVAHIGRGVNYMKTTSTLSGSLASLYDQLKVGDTNANIQIPANKGTYYDVICESIAWEAYFALMEEDAAKLVELGTALSTYSIKYLEFYEPDYDNYLTHDANMYVAFAYDYLHSTMPEVQRAPVRQLLSKMTKYRWTKGSFRERPNGNWDNFHDNLVLCALAIEGEEGYDVRIHDAHVENKRRFFTGNGVHESGFAHEGWGYYTFGLERGALACLASARRGENLFETTRLYDSFKVGFREIQPWIGGTMYSHHDGQWWGNGYWLGDALWVMKFAFPDDSIVDYTTRAFLDYYSEDRKLRLGAAMFGISPMVGNESPVVAATEHEMPVSVFCKERGIVNTRSAWSTDALRMDFECRMDLYDTGHVHSECNSFTLMSHGREWVTDNGYHDAHNDLHSTVLIDGKGQGGSSILTRWPSMPGRFIDYKDNGLCTVAVGDAKTSYDYHRDTGSGDAAVVNSLKWADFSYANLPVEDIPEWKNSASVGNIYAYNPVQRAFRTVALVRDEHPFVLVVDDIQKDAATHDYEWLVNVPQGDEMVVVSSSTTEMVLRHKNDTATGTPRLLIRVIDSNGTAGTIALESRAIGQYNPGELHNVVVIPRDDVVAPDYKVILYPFLEGEALPQTTLANDRLTLTAPGGQTNVVGFSFDAVEARTLVDVASPFDLWRSEYGIEDQAPETDGDGNGIPLAMEYALHGTPEGAEDGLWIDPLLPGMAVAQIPPEDAVMGMEWSTNLVSQPWSSEGVEETGTNFTVNGVLSDTFYFRMKAGLLYN